MPSAFQPDPLQRKSAEARRLQDGRCARHYSLAVAIPDFDSDGYLPEGFHPATQAEIKSRFVDAVAGSPTRRAIYDGWADMRTAVTEIVQITSQWLDGSFVTNKHDPRDADVITFLEGAEVDALPTYKKRVLKSIFAETASKTAWRCDSYVVVNYPVGHDAHSANERTAAFYGGLFASVRNSSRKKGILVVT
jgi:hypothetical protein